MPNPTSRHSRSRKNKRRANWKLSPISIATCPECDEPTLPHRICQSCGTYKGKKIIEVVEKELA